MTIIYRFVIFLYSLAIKIAAFIGHEKAILFVQGRKNYFRNLKGKLGNSEKRIWIHAASLGEFEQGRPIIERIKQQYPHIKIFLTFFSPSGYEVRKNYTGADYIFYLPLDTPGNAERFIDLVKPYMVFFIKYEYWYYYITNLKKRNMPIYLCSAIFRQKQPFFKWYGSWYRSILKCFTHIFVQTAKSVELLKNIGYLNCTITGDTRFDRVYSIAVNSREIPEVGKFVNGEKCFIAGSSWGADEELFCGYINETVLFSKALIAPHEIDVAHIEKIEKLLTKKYIRYSSWKNNPNGNYDVMIIDNIGMLSSLYRYGQVAYIGGGFGKGIHNILEAATFGLPVIFGPNYKKFQEAIDLIKSGGAHSIKNYYQLKEKLDVLYTDTSILEETGKIAKEFVRQNVGATDAILVSVQI